MSQIFMKYIMENCWFNCWGRATHICVSKPTIIASGNGLSPGRHQAIIWNNAGILSIGFLGTNVSEILIEILTFSFKKMRLKVSSAKWRPFCLGLNVLIKPVHIWLDSQCITTTKHNTVQTFAHILKDALYILHLWTSFGVHCQFTVHSWYLTVFFSKKLSKRCHIAPPWGQVMGSLLWVHSLNKVHHLAVKLFSISCHICLQCIESIV